MQEKTGASERESLAEFERQLTSAGVIGVEDDDVERFRAEMYKIYERECSALVYEGASFSVTEGSDSSEVVDVNILGYSRHPRVGAHFEDTMLAGIEDIRKRAQVDADAFRRRIETFLCRHYGYCSVCAKETFDMVMNETSFYKKPMFGFGGGGF